MRKPQKLTLLSLFLTFTQFVFLTHLCLAFPQTEDGSGLDDPSVIVDDEKTLIEEIPCSTNKECGEGESQHPFSYCDTLINPGYCACMDGRTSKNGGKCRCEEPKTDSCLVVNPEIDGACKKLDCGDQGTCKPVESGAYCDCNNGWGGQVCELELDGFGPKIPESDPTKIPDSDPTKIPTDQTTKATTNSTTTAVSENQGLLGWFDENKTLAIGIVLVSLILVILICCLVYRKTRNNEPKSTPGLGMQ